jgi:hypothetical protein
MLNAYVNPGSSDVARLVRLRGASRLARSNAEALVERMLAEPERKAAIRPRAATGLLAAIRRNALAALALHAGVERGVDRALPMLSELTSQIQRSLTLLAEAAREERAPSPLPPLRQTHQAIAKSLPPVVEQETDLMVDAINTMADLLTREAAAPGTPLPAYAIDAGAPDAAVQESHDGPARAEPGISSR